MYLLSIDSFLINMVFYRTGYIVRKSNIHHHNFLQQNLTLKKVKPNERNKYVKNNRVY